MILTYDKIVKNIDETCDVCVIGSGAGGAPMAKELQEAGLSVILLEEGSYYQTKDFRNSDTIESLIKLYREGGSTFTIGKPNISYAEGRTVGGSTTINGGICWRTPDKILKRWQWENGLADLTPKRMDYFFSRVEEIISAKPVLSESMNKDSETLKKGAIKLGYEVRANIRSHQACVGTNQCLTGCPTGAKQSTLVSYIPLFLKKGGRLIANCRVRKIKKSGHYVTGVKGVIIDPTTGKTKAHVRIRSKVVVASCGAIQTPALLLRSGIHDKKRLTGGNLFMHPNTKVIGVFDDPIYGWKGVNQAYQITEFMGEGIIMAVNFIPLPIMALAFPHYGKNYLSTVKEIYNHCIFGAALSEDASRGRVHNLPFDQTLATYQLNQQDFHLALRSIALLSEVYFAAGAKRVYLPLRGLQELHTIDDLRKIYEYRFSPVDLELMTVHMMGTCQMGHDASRSVVNQYGEHHELRGLFVADASVFPTSIGVNPSETIMALSTRSAFHIAENVSKYLE